MKILILNGPNLNLLGIREKSIYGETSFEEYLSGLRDFYTMVEIDYYQSNVEGELINKIHEVGFSYDGIILNAGSLHTYFDCYRRCYFGNTLSRDRSSYF